MTGRIAQEPGSLLGVTELAALLEVSRQRAAIISMTEGFPRPVDQLRMGPVYRRADVEAWRTARQADAAGARS